MGPPCAARLWVEDLYSEGEGESTDGLEAIEVGVRQEMGLPRDGNLLRGGVVRSIGEIGTGAECIGVTVFLFGGVAR